MEKIITFWKRLNIEKKLLGLYVIAFINTQTTLFAIDGRKVWYTDLVFLLLFAVFAWKTLKNRRPFLTTRLEVPLVLMVLLFAVSLINSVSLKSSFSEFASLAYLIVLFIVVANVISGRRGLSIFLYIWVIIASLVAIIGFLAFFTAIINNDLASNAFLYYSPIESMAHHFPRIDSTFLNPNMLCTYLHVSLVFALYLFFSESIFRKKFFIVVCTLIILAAAFLTGSRRFTGLLLSMFLILLWCGRERIFGLFKGLTFCAFVLFLVMTVLTSIWVIFPIEIVKSADDGTSDLRVSPGYSLHFLQYVTALHMFEKHPVIGVGYGTYTKHFKENVDWDWVRSSFGFEAYPQAIKVVEDKTLYFDPHSVYLGALAETGIVGFAGMMYFFLAYAVSLARKLKTDDKKRIVTACILAGFLGFLLNGFTIDILSMRHFWFMMAIGALTLRSNFKWD